MYIDTPELRHISPTLSGQALISVWTMPLEEVMADKVEGMLRRGTANTRYKDYWDISRLAETQDFAGDRLESTLQATCAYYGTLMTVTGDVFSSMAFLQDTIQMAHWQQYLTQVQRTAMVLPTFTEVITLIRKLYVPVLQGTASGQTWSHQVQQWIP